MHCVALASLRPRDVAYARDPLMRMTEAVAEFGMTIEAAMEHFLLARSPGIWDREYIEKLYLSVPQPSLTPKSLLLLRVPPAMGLRRMLSAYHSLQQQVCP